MKTYVIEKATKVTLRGRVSTNGKMVSLYMDWGAGKNRQTDWDFDRIYFKPENQDQTDHNKAILQEAKIKLSLKNARLLKDNTLLRNNLSYRDVGSFFDIVKNKPDQDGVVKSLATKAGYDCAKKAISKFIDLDKVMLRDVDKKMVRDIKEYLLLESGLVRNSAAVYFSKFNSVICKAVEEEYLDKDPSIGVEPISKDEPRVNYVLHEDLQKLKGAHCNDPILKKAGLFASQTGMRCGDIKPIRWKRITKAGELYRIQLTQEKTDKPYIVHFKQSVMDILGEPGEPEDLIFPGFKNDNDANADLNLWFAKAQIEPRGYPDERFTMHDFRHTFAITLGLNGANLYEISQLLGHASIRTTEIHYARILEQMKQKITHNLPDLL